jgi:hypothetical protein
VMSRLPGLEIKARVTWHQYKGVCLLAFVRAFVVISSLLYMLF